MHAAKFDSAYLSLSMRSVPKLVTCCVDRVVHAPRVRGERYQCLTANPPQYVGQHKPPTIITRENQYSGHMASFAERIGQRTPRTLIQTNDLDTDTRTDLWNVLVVLQEVFEKLSIETYERDSTESQVLDSIWTRDFKMARDELDHRSRVWMFVKNLVQTKEWFDALDLIESVVKYLDKFQTAKSAGVHEAVAEAFNISFERYLVGYRFIGNEITPVSATSEVEAVEEALEQTQSLTGARHALERAIDLLSDRQNPDYPNSIKESISAVEAVVKKITNAGTLGAGLGKLEKAGLRIHPALKEAWSKMYGWTSDDNGIRHAGIEAAEADQALAKYMLISCSAFVSYLIEEGHKKELLV